VSNFQHTSVLASEVVAHTPTKTGAVIADLTLGGGGHAAAIFGARPGLGLYIGVDRDAVALRASTQRLAPHAAKLRTVQARFSQTTEVVNSLGLTRVDALLADLGVSSPQLDEASRGFSFMREGPLDMRMGEGPTLAEYLASVDEHELARVIRLYGEERFAGRVARAIVAHRTDFHTTTELAAIVRAAMPKTEHRIDPATRTFQALRIVVNDELGELDQLLAVLPDLLEDDGLAMIISFHSLEDRAVKEAFRLREKGCTCPPKLPVCRCGFIPTLAVVTKKPLVAGEEECRLNPRARSAKLRIARRLPRAA
jgi:16S rRNA (cytosine1402-N4)-methyltransferase